MPFRRMALGLLLAVVPRGALAQAEPARARNPNFVVIGLTVDEPVDLALTRRKGGQPSYEYARCVGSCEIAIKPGKYRLEIGDSEETRAGKLDLELDQPGNYRLSPASRQTLLPGALLAALGPGLMGAGTGLFFSGMANPGNDLLPFGGAFLLAAGAGMTFVGIHLYSRKPRVDFEPGRVRRDNAVEAYPKVVTHERAIVHEEGQPVPRGFRVRREPSYGLWTAGITTFGVSYGLTALAGGILVGNSDSPASDARVFIPVGGPLLVGGGWQIAALPQLIGLALFGL